MYFNNLDQSGEDDPDGDSLANNVEMVLMGTTNVLVVSDPTNFNTDNDGIDDGTEIGQGSDPSDPSDGGQPPATNTTTLVTLFIQSANPQASIKITLSDETNSYWVVSSGNDPTSNSFAVVNGRSYTVSLEQTNNVVPLMGGSGYFADVSGEGVVKVDPNNILGDHATDLPQTVNTATVHVVKSDITFSDSDDSDWGILEEKKVILSDRTTRIKIKITPQLPDIPTIFNILGDELKIKTSGTAPNGKTHTLTAQNTTLIQGSGFSELRCSFTRSQLQVLDVLPDQEADSTTEKAWYDIGINNPGASSNLSDSHAFDSGITAQSRGQASNYGNLESTPPNSLLDKSFFQAAGREVISVQLGTSESHKRQIMNQADFFYFSGHGNHATAEVHGNGPSDVAGYWSKDLDTVIIAGCSVLDINDYENHYTGTAHTASPGKQWESTGPEFLLGYCWYAPLDTQNSDSIISDWCSNRGSSGDFEAWKDANYNSNGRHACAIEAGVKYGHFHRTFIGTYQWKEIPKSQW